MMNVYRDVLQDIGGYLTDKGNIHLSRVELFLQEIGRREPLYFQQRAIDEKDSEYAGDNYSEHYYKVCCLSSACLNVCLLSAGRLTVYLRTVSPSPAIPPFADQDLRRAPSSLQRSSLHFPPHTFSI